MKSPSMCACYITSHFDSLCSHNIDRSHKLTRDFKPGLTVFKHLIINQLRQTHGISGMLAAFLATDGGIPCGKCAVRHT